MDPGARLRHLSLVLVLLGGPSSAQVTSLGVSKTADPAVVSAGDEAAFVIVVQNTGGFVAQNVTLTDALPAGLTWTDDSASCAIASGTLTCAFGTLVPGGIGSVRVSAPTSASKCGVYPNAVTASASNASPAQAGSAVAVLCPDLQTTRVPDEPLVKTGALIGVTLSVLNLGPGAAHDVELDVIPPEGILLDFEPDAPCAVQDFAVCAFGDIPAGTGRSVHAVMTAPVDCGSVDLVTVRRASNSFTQQHEGLLTEVFKAGDANGDCAATVADVFYLINFLFAGGPAPKSSP